MTNDAVDLFTLASKDNDSWAQLTLGMLYLSAKGVRKDPKKAVGFIKKSADNKNALGQMVMGMMSFSGVAPIV